MIAPELKPCPFCGGAPEIDFGLLHAPREVGRQFISCPTVTCGAYAYGADAWNIRADLAPAAPKVKALVEALQDALDAWDTHRESGDMMEGYWVSDARAALAALEGGDG